MRLLTTGIAGITNGTQDIAFSNHKWYLLTNTLHVSKIMQAPFGAYAKDDIATFADVAFV